MKLKVLGLLCLASLWISNGIQAQATTLSLGDIAFTGYNSDAASVSAGDDFSFVLLKDVDAGTTITFTDRGWFNAGGFRTATEGILTITLPASSCGDEFRLLNNPSTTTTWILYGDTGTNIGSFTSSGTGSGFILDSTGDQLFAYQGPVPTGGSQGGFIAALQTHGNWNSDATDSFTSALPSIFSSNPGNDIAFGSRVDQDNGKYQCGITGGLPAEIRAAIYDVPKWLFSNSSSQRFNLLTYCNFTCTSTCTDPIITSLTTNSTIGSNTFCPGDNVVITINGTKGDATTWNLYSGSCGGSVVGSTPAVDGSTTITIPSIGTTATYYVGGIGGCVASPTCTSILITVNGLTANAGSDQKISGSTTANISGNGSGTWTITGIGDGSGYFEGTMGTTSSTIPSTTFNGTAGQTYTLQWEVTNAGCTSSTAEVEITFLSSTTLGLGDIAFTGYNSDAPDEFRFVLLKDINAGTRITFTENGWFSAGGFRGGERTIEYEFCRPYKCGDEFSATSSSGSQSGLNDDGGKDAAAVISGSFPQLAASGDQIFAYQGTAPTTGGASNWIAAIQMNGAWNTDATSSETSAQPSAFTDGVNSISISPEVQNASYDCSITTNSPANLRAAVNTASNWTTSNSRISLSYCSFTCGSCVEPVLTSLSAPATACPGQTVALNINGTLNGANEWAIYTGSCGGTELGTTTGSSFNVTPTATTTYYVSGRGGCVITETCQMVTISVTAFQADAGPNDVEKINGSNSTILQANGGFGDGTWSFVDAGDGEGSFSDKNDPAATFSGNAGQSYTLKWTIHNTGCPDTEDEVTIVFLDQTGLTLGDLAFIAYSADEDDFAFVLLKDINAGTSIKFTDRGWLAAGGFRAGEGTITVEFCRPYYCGDEFNVFNAPQEIKDASGQLAGTIVGAPLEPSTTGDQIFAYQGPETNLITGIQMNGAWDADATNTNTSAKPAIFTDGVNSISFPTEVDNAYLDCSKISSASAVQINNSANWITSDGTSATLPLNCNLACCTPGDPISINGYTGTDPLCPTSQQTLSLPTQASLNDDDEWVWYTGSCGGTEVARDVASINVSPTVTTTYYVRAEGSCSGTSGACASFTVEIGDIEDPMLTCPFDITVSNDAGECSAVVDFEATASDNCDSDVDIAYSQNPGSIFPEGTTQVNVTATDNFSRTAICSFSVTVNDTEAPIAKCPGVIQDVELDLMGNGTLPANIGDGNSTDNCGSFETSPALTFTCDDLGEQMVTLTAVDPSGNTNAIDCSFKVVDNVGACNQAPVAECRSISVSADPNSCETTIDEAQIDDGSFDPDGDMIQLSLDNNGPFAVGGPYTVELTVSDGSLMDKCTAQVTVTDDEAPTFSNCPGNISVGNDPGICGAMVNWTPPTLNDNCPGVSSNSSHTPGALFPVGSTTVVYIGSDAAGNNAMNCSFVVTVNDTEAPTFSNCPGNISVGNDPGECGANVDWQLPIFSDNCPGGSTSSNFDPLDFFPVGSTTVTYEGSDAAGNAAIDCSFVVTVNDTEAPNFSDCPGNISVSNDPGDCGANVDWIAPTLEDNCPGASDNASHNPGGFVPVGSMVVTYSGVDVAGNAAMNCSFVVTVNDTEKPSAQCSPTTVTLPPSGTASITAADVDNGSTDNCAVAGLSVAPSSFGTATVGSNPVTLTVTDIYGNVASCNTTVTVEKRTSTLTNLGVFSGQYSDQVTLQAQLKDINGTPLANQDIIFEITGEPTAVAKTNASGIATANIVLTQAPNILGSNYQVKTSFAGNSIYLASQDSDPFTILQEDARITYTGVYFVSTANTNSSTATVTLAATIQDISDGFRGDIRNAKVTFYNRTNGANTPISPALPVQLISSGDQTVGNVVYEWQNVDIGNADSDVFEIGIVVSHYYTRNSMVDNVMITVSKPISKNFVTGGGYLLLNNSAGQVAGDNGSKSNFGFNVKYNKKGTKLQGKFQALIRRTESDGVHTYRIKSNKLTSLSVDPNTGTATLSGKANIQDVTDSNNPISVAGNNIFTVTMVDNGEPGTSDAIGITLYNAGGGLWYSSNWSGTQTVDQVIAGGNIVVHSGGNGNLQSIETLPTSQSAAQEDLDINIYPNPAANFFNVDLRPFIDSHLTLQVFHVNGRLMHTQTFRSFSESTVRLETSNWMSGLYFIRVTIDEALQYHKKVLIQHP